MGNKVWQRGKLCSSAKINYNLSNDLRNYDADYDLVDFEYTTTCSAQSKNAIDAQDKNAFLKYFNIC